jgi:hypothetical protein
VAFRPVEFGFPAKVFPMTKYVFVTGGVVSSIGEGHRLSARWPLILEARGLKVNDRKTRSLHQR